jgi:2-oxoglutarate dehydrogenase complex dehydrogenase (E1) component-like enzyme
MSSLTTPEFGSNDWYVQEKYEGYIADPTGVDQVWRDFFKGNTPPET